MQAVSIVLILAWIAMTIIALIGLVRGHIDWARIHTRKHAAWVLAASIPVVVLAGLVAPKDDTSHVTAQPAPSSSHVPATRTTTAEPVAATPVPTTSHAATTTTAAPTPPTTVPAPATTAAGLSDQQIADLTYIGVLDMNHVRYANKDAAIDVAHKVCTAKESGDSDTAIGLAILNTGLYSAQDAGTIVGAAESAYCPAGR